MSPGVSLESMFVISINKDKTYTLNSLMWHLKLKDLKFEVFFLLECSSDPGLTYDRRGLDGLHRLLQSLQMRVIMSELCLLVIQVASSLQE